MLNLYGKTISVKVPTAKAIVMSGADIDDVTDEICTKWNERESTWRKRGSCQSRGTNQSRS